jgi:hypothetical protein
MSLRIFHVIFIVASLLLCLYVSLWGVRVFAATRSGNALMLAIVFSLCGVALLAYARRAFRKLRDLS